MAAAVRVGVNTLASLVSQQYPTEATTASLKPPGWGGGEASNTPLEYVQQETKPLFQKQAGLGSTAKLQGGFCTSGL